MKKFIKTIQYSYYEPRFHSYKARGPYPHNLTLGYENEVENRNRDASDKTEEVINQYDFLYAKEDASLDSGCEINTHPFNLNWFHKHNVIKYIDDVIDAGFRAKRSCGFHIHMGRKFFTDTHLAKMVKLFYTNGPFLKKVSLRAGWSFEEYSSVKEVAEQINEELANDWNYDDDRVGDYPKLDFNKWKYCRRAVEELNDEGLKMSALNLMHDNTIEVRIFQGRKSVV